ncbi:hypothetical protein [Nonomuraea africana]|uniref:Uncharacterized protein n=1 Tax=Nonomuraea africana TaxID=46171 RepID=A0ABR9KV99_9ACTN|nr:hypothetical protein [Nonomuraea africana]MBE1565958.1 hypothetical protein [Nonomuraea africana]
MIGRTRIGHLCVLAVLLVLFTGAGSSWSVPSLLPAHAGAASSAEEIAERLRQHVIADPESGIMMRPDVAGPVMSCADTVAGLWPPQGVPSYSALLKVRELAAPLTVRFWVTTPARARETVDAARQAAAGCSGPETDGPGRAQEPNRRADSAFDRRGWSGVQGVASQPGSSDNGDWYTTAHLVAARGALLTEIAWDWSFEQGDGLDPRWRKGGTAAAEAVLSAVGGDPAHPAPDGSPAHGATALLAARLPATSAYGEAMRPWPEVQGEARKKPGWSTPVEHDMTCSFYFHRQEGLPGGMPAVTRLLFGSVAVREDMSVLPDAQTAETVRRRLLRWDSWPEGDKIDPCYEPDVNDDAEPPAVTIGRRIQPLRHGSWTGQVETFATRRAKLPAQPTYRDSVAHVAIAVRRGTTVVYLRWQGTAGPNLEAGLARGRAAVIGTLEALT